MAILLVDGHGTVNYYRSGMRVGEERLMLYLDSTSITAYLTCREQFRLHYLHGGMGLSRTAISIHREAGIAVHKGIESFYAGKPFEAALDVALSYMQLIPLQRVLPADLGKWATLQNSVPDMLAAYYDSREQPERFTGLIEHEFRHIYSDHCSLVGRVDRFANGTLTDVKTATQMGKEKEWRREYREAALRDIQLPLYDYVLRKEGHDVTKCELEIIVKPSERFGTKARVETIDLPEIIAYRSRTESQLSRIIPEIERMVREESDQWPWPMAAANVCNGKFGPCQFRQLCNYGVNERGLRDYTERQEHLSGISRRYDT